MNYTVEFPFPYEHHRELLWRGMFPPETPLAEDLDFAFLARQFSMSGGNIKNAALSAIVRSTAAYSLRCARKVLCPRSTYDCGHRNVAHELCASVMGYPRCRSNA